LKTCPML